MSFSAHLTHTPTGIAITFAAPVSRLDLDPSVAAHLASLLAIEARARLAGVVRTLEAENGSHPVVRHLAQPKTSKKLSHTGTRSAATAIPVWRPS